MPRQSRCKTLPPQLRAELDRLLTDGRHSLDEVVAHLQALGGEVSRSSVHRYSKEFEDVAARIREGRETAAKFVQELGDLPQGDVGRVLVEIVSNLAFRTCMGRSGDGDVDTKELMLLARTVRDLAQTTAVSAKIEMEIRDRLKREMADEARAKLAEASSGHGTLDPTAAQEALRILGFA